ncbi:MAG: hypothetical protein ACF788_12865 [Novipirellula sp. JB048]
MYESDGTLQGVRKGTAKLKAEYRPDRSEKPIEAEADVTVESTAFDNLTLAVDPATLGVGKQATITATLLSSDGQTHSANKSSSLQLSVSPSHVAMVKGDHLIAMAVGEAVLNATHEDLAAEYKFSVDKSTAKTELPFAQRQCLRWLRRSGA